jgi:hypothetical protein
MASRLITALTPLALTALLAGCVPPGAGGPSADIAAPASNGPSSSYAPAPDAQQGDCNADPVQNMIGQSYSDSVGVSLQQRSGSQALRLLKPGEVMTMEYNPTRINVILDDHGAIEALRCG